MTCPQCGGSMSPKQTSRGTVQECNQDNGECLNEKGYPSSVWPKTRGGFQGRPQRQAPPARKQSQQRAPMSDDRSARIERQHSQEMALRFFALDGSGQQPETKQLREMISWFQRDIGTDPTRRSAPTPQRDPEPPQDISDGPPYDTPSDNDYDDVPF